MRPTICGFCVWMIAAAWGQTPSLQPEAERLARSDLARVTYAPITRAATEGVSAMRYIYGAGEYVLLGAPSITLSLANGGPLGLAKKIAFDTVQEIIKEALNHPQKASRKIAKAAYDLGLDAYRQNYRLYEQFQTVGRFNEEEARQFVRNWYLQGYMSAAKGLYNDTTRYEKKDVLRTPDKLLLQQAESTAVGLARTGFGSMGSVEVDWLFKTLKTEFNVVDSAVKGSVGLGVYPPYQTFLVKSRQINAAVVAAMGGSGSGTPARLTDLGKITPDMLSIKEWEVSEGKDPATMDLIFCVDTTGSMEDDIAAVKTSAANMLDEVFAQSPDARIAMVAYRDYGSSYVTKGYPFTRDKEEMRRNLMSLDIGEGGDTPEAVYEALLHAIHTRDLGAWRDGVKKVIVLMGDAPPHTRRHTLDQVAKAAEEVDPAHVFPIAVAGADTETLRSFGEIARRTGGVMGTTATAASLPKEILKMVELGGSLADASWVNGRVEAVLGGTIEAEVEDASKVLVGMEAFVFSAKNPELVIAQGPVEKVTGRRVQVTPRAEYSVEKARLGCGVRVVR